MQSALELLQDCDMSDDQNSDFSDDEPVADWPREGEVGKVSAVTQQIYATSPFGKVVDSTLTQLERVNPDSTCILEFDLREEGARKIVLYNKAKERVEAKEAQRGVLTFQVTELEAMRSGTIGTYGAHRQFMYCEMSKVKGWDRLVQNKFGVNVRRVNLTKEEDFRSLRGQVPVV